MTSPYYLPSGRLPVVAVPLTALGAMATLPAAWLYGVATAHVPLFLDFLLLSAFALWIGWISRTIASKAKVRNPKWMGKLGIVVGVAAWYSQWTAHASVILRDAKLIDGTVPQAFITTLADPVKVLGVASGLMERGWSWAGFHAPGFVVAVFWLAECWILLGFAHLFGRMRAAEPFCEKSGTWSKKIEVPYKFAFVEDIDSVARLLEAWPDQLVATLRPLAKGAEQRYTKLTIYRCADGCEPYVSMTRYRVESAKQRAEEKGQLIVDFLKVPSTNADELFSACKQIAEAPLDEEGGTQRPTPDQLSQAVEDLTNDRFDAALEAALPYVQADDRNLRTDATRVCALASARLGRWQQSLDYWRSLSEYERSAHNALQVASTAVMAGQPELGDEWFRKAYAMNLAWPEMPAMNILTNFVTALTQTGQMRAALPHLDEIKKTYERIGRTDPTYLWSHQVPLFCTFLEKSAPVIRAIMDVEQGRSWYLSMVPHLDDSGKDELRAWLEKDFSGAPGC